MAVLIDRASLTRQQNYNRMVWRFFVYKIARSIVPPICHVDVRLPRVSVVDTFDLRARLLCTISRSMARVFLGYRIDRRIHLWLYMGYCCPAPNHLWSSFCKRLQAEGLLFFFKGCEGKTAVASFFIQRSSLWSAYFGVQIYCFILFLFYLI